MIRLVFVNEIHIILVIIFTAQGNAQTHSPIIEQPAVPKSCKCCQIPPLYVKECIGKLDLCFIVEASSDSDKMWADARAMITLLSTCFDIIGDYGVKISVVTFSQRANLTIKFDSNGNLEKNALFQALEGVRFNNGPASNINYAAGINMVINEAFKGNRDRPGVPNGCVFIASSRDNGNFQQLEKSAATLQKMTAGTFALGQNTDIVGKKEFEAVATKGTRSFLEIDKLFADVHEILKVNCQNVPRTCCTILPSEKDPETDIEPGLVNVYSITRYIVLTTLYLRQETKYLIYTFPTKVKALEVVDVRNIFDTFKRHIFKMISLCWKTPSILLGNKSVIDKKKMLERWLNGKDGYSDEYDQLVILYDRVERSLKLALHRKRDKDKSEKILNQYIGSLMKDVKRFVTELSKALP